MLALAFLVALGFFVHWGFFVAALLIAALNAVGAAAETTANQLNKLDKAMQTEEEPLPENVVRLTAMDEDEELM